jgi:hypothetical protein
VTVHLQLGGDWAKLKADPPADFVMIAR